MRNDRRAQDLVPELRFGDVLGAVVEQMPVKSRGTYDRADPTAYEKREGWINFHYSPFTRRGYPGEFRVRADDCTWGVEVTILRPDGSERLRFYWDRGCGNPGDGSVVLRRGNGPDVKRFLRSALLEGRWSRDRPQREVEAHGDYPYIGP